MHKPKHGELVDTTLDAGDRMTGAERREWVEEMVDPEAVLWNECDDAIIGVSAGRVVYGRDALIAVFVAQGMTDEDAEDWVGYNIEGAYVGEYTPLIVQEVPESRA